MTSALVIVPRDQKDKVLSFYAPPDRGHVDRHARLSALVGRAMGLNRTELETLCRSSLLHEFGRVGFSYDLRDSLVHFANQYGLIDKLSRTDLIRQNLLPDWPAPEQVIEAIESQIGKKRKTLKQTGGRLFGDFEEDRKRIGIRWDGSLPGAQRRNLAILFAHDQGTLAVVQRHRTVIPFDVEDPMRILAVFIEIVERKDLSKAGDRDLLMAMILAGADQLEITNNRERWARSRRRPGTGKKTGREKRWKSFHLVNEEIAGRDTTLPSVHRFLVERHQGKAQEAGRRVRDAIFDLFYQKQPDPSLVEILEEGRGMPVSGAEGTALEKARSAYPYLSSLA